jgi:1-acyl-sn-glycerol-3-phosphate acyltransferase
MRLSGQEYVDEYASVVKLRLAGKSGEETGKGGEEPGKGGEEPGEAGSSRSA